jgi:hypothetical protein
MNSGAKPRGGTSDTLGSAGQAEECRFGRNVLSMANSFSIRNDIIAVVETQRQRKSQHMQLGAGSAWVTLPFN